MADNTIALQTQTPSFTATLGNLLNIKQQQLGLQQGQQTLESQDIALQSARQANQERKNWIGLVQSDPSIHPREDGTVDTGQEANAKILNAMPQTGLAKIQERAKSNSDIYAARTSLQGLNKGAADMFGRATKSMIDKDPSEQAGIAQANIKQFPETKPFWDSLFSTITRAKGNADQIAPGNPQAQDAAISHVLDTFSRMPLDVQTQNELKTPRYSDVGSVYKQINPSSTAPDVIKTVMPGDSFEQDPVSKQLMVVRRDAKNKIVAARPASDIGGGMPGPAAPGVQPPQGFTPIPKGETADTFAQLQADRKASNDAAAQTGVQASNNRQLLDLMKSGTTTGSNAKTVQKVFSSIGIPWDSKEATNLNQASHYIAQQTQANEKAMGVNTDAGRETSALASAPLEFNSPAFISAVKANDAVTSGTKAFNIGLENAVKSGGPAAIRTFKNDWSTSFDPVVYRYANALRDGDNAEKMRIEAQYGKPPSGKQADPNSDWGRFVSKIAKLHALEGQ